MGEVITMSMHEYSRTRGVNRRSLQEKIDDGVVKLVGGRVDPQQADNAWLRRSLSDSEGQKNAQAKIAQAAARLRLARDCYEKDRARYVDRAESIALAAAEADDFIEKLCDAPHDYVVPLAQALRIDPKTATDILTRFANYLLIEIGNIRTEAIRAAERA